jgi:DNA-binding GntR family transcriptional regulator
VAARDRVSAETQPVDLSELRLLLELTAVRKLADRGLSSQELELTGRLADATMRSARHGDVPGYLRADLTFHLCLLELTSDPAVRDVARLVLAPDRGHASRAEGSGHLMVRAAREHRELVGMLADGLVSAADDLLRLHLSRRPAGRPGRRAPGRAATGRLLECVTWPGA